MGNLQEDPCPAFIPDSSSQKPEEQDSGRTNKAGPCTVAYKSSLFIQTHLPGQSCLPLRKVQDGKGRGRVHRTTVSSSAARGAERLRTVRWWRLLSPHPRKTTSFSEGCIRGRSIREAQRHQGECPRGSSWSEGGPAGQMPGVLVINQHCNISVVMYVEI